MDAILIQPDTTTTTFGSGSDSSLGFSHEKTDQTSSSSFGGVNDREREKRRETAGRGGGHGAYVRVRVMPGSWNWVRGVLERVGLGRRVTVGGGGSERRQRDDGENGGGRETGRGRSTGVGLSITAAGVRRSYALAPCHHLFVSWFFVLRSEERKNGRELMYPSSHFLPFFYSILLVWKGYVCFLARSYIDADENLNGTKID